MCEKLTFLTRKPAEGKKCYIRIASRNDIYAYDGRGEDVETVSPLCECVKSSGLLADSELLLCDDRAVTVDVFADQVVEEAAALTYKSLECAGSGVVLVVGLEVLSKMLDAH